MNIATFLLHFFYISGIFIAGGVLGYLVHDKLQEKLQKFFKQNK